MALKYTLSRFEVVGDSTELSSIQLQHRQTSTVMFNVYLCTIAFIPACTSLTVPNDTTRTCTAQQNQLSSAQFNYANSVHRAQLSSTALSSIQLRSARFNWALLSSTELSSAQLSSTEPTSVLMCFYKKLRKETRVSKQVRKNWGGGLVLMG